MMKLFALTVCLAGCSLNIWAQATQRTQVIGLVQDVTGYSVPGAHVAITNTDTGISVKTDTAADGTYTLPNLVPGPYRLEVAKDGFAAYTQTGIVLQVNTNPSINVTLKVGALSERVEVAANAAMVETQSNAIGQVIDQNRVLELPLNGRQITDLVALSGAATNLASIIGPNGASAGLALNIVSNKNYPTSVSVSVAGGQGAQTLYLLDGGSNMDLVSNVGLPMPFPDALQEFKLETSSLPANYGTQPGGVVNVITKSGSNSLHGSAFEFLRNYAFNARNFFAPRRDSLKRNQFGATLGGPLIKNKLFFFGGYQGTYQKIAPAANISYVATADELAGDFRQLMSPACNAGVAKTLPAPFVNNQISPSLLNPVALNILKLMPTSTDPCGKLLYGIPGSEHENQFLSRIDYQLSEKQAIFGRFFFTDFQHPPIFTDNLLTMSTDAAAGLSDRVQTAVIGHNYTLNASTINSVRLAFTRSAITRVTPPTIPTYQSLGSNVSAGVPGYFALTVSNFFTPICVNCSPGPWNATSYQLSDELSMTRGRHQIAAGFNIFNLRMNSFGNFQRNGQFIFTGQITGNSMADFMRGNAATFGQSNGQIGDDRLWVPSLYIQDNFRLSSRLTLNAGLRWDPYLSPRANVPQVSIFDLGWYNSNRQTKAFTNAPAGLLFEGDDGMPGGQHYFFSRMATFAPRFGVVFDPRGKGQETIRAGYGMFYGQTPLFQIGGYHAPFTNAISIPVPAGGLSDPYSGKNPFPTPNPLPSNFTFPNFGTLGIGGFKQDMKPTYMQQWNFALQKQLRNDWLISATYLGNHTLHLVYSEPQNPAVYIPGTCVAGQYGLAVAGPCSTAGNVNFRRVLYLANPTKARPLGNIANVGDGGTGSYHGLLLSAQHRFSNNFTILANHTWSHCLTQADIGLNGGGVAQDPYNRNAETGNCLVDRRNVFNLTTVARTPKFSSRPMQLILGNWTESSIFSASTGSFTTVTVGVDNALRGLTDRPNQIADASLSNPTISKWFNTDAFRRAPLGQLGSLGRGTIRGPGAWNLDLALARAFSLTERTKLDFRAEAFNIMNHARFANPNTTMTSPAFGQIQFANAPRIMQFALKYSF